MKNKRLLLLVLFLVIIKFIFIPFSGYIDSQAEVYSSNRALYHRLLNVSERREALKSKQVELSEIVEKLEKRVITYSDSKQPTQIVLEKLRGFADLAHLEITNVQPKELVSDEFDYMPVTLSVKGSRDGVFSFIESVESGQSSFLISQMTLYHDKLDIDSFIVSFDILALMRKST